MWCRNVCALGMLGTLMACATGTVERHRLADGSWQITCKLPMDDCIRRTEVLCNDKRYRIVSGQSKNVIRDVPPGTREYRSSELTVVCSDRESDDKTTEAPAPLVSGPALSRPEGGLSSVCIPGATQSCVGPAGCQGGQACRPDGSGFGGCDCGVTPKPSADAGF
jgi:hypothetical protein